MRGQRGKVFGKNTPLRWVRGLVTIRTHATTFAFVPHTPHSDALPTRMSPQPSPSAAAELRRFLAGFSATSSPNGTPFPAPRRHRDDGWSRRAKNGSLELSPAGGWDRHYDPDRDRQWPTEPRNKEPWCNVAQAQHAYRDTYMQM